MKSETKKQIIAIFILLTFVGSSAAFALISVIPVEEQQQVQLVFDRPLDNSEEAPYLQQNYVIVKYFWSDNCAYCDLASQALDSVGAELNNTIVIERIKTDDWGNYTESLGVMTVPTFYLKGQTIVVTNTTDSDELVRAICPLYFYYIEQCAFLT